MEGGRKSFQYLFTRQNNNRLVGVVAREAARQGGAQEAHSDFGNGGNRTIHVFEAHIAIYLLDDSKRMNYTTNAADIIMLGRAEPEWDRLDLS